MTRVTPGVRSTFEGLSSSDHGGVRPAESKLSTWVVLS